MSYDSRVETYQHIKVVQGIINRVVTDLLNRSEVHDKSKLEMPEVDVFDEYTPKLKLSKYGSDEHKELLAKMQKNGLNHHYANNSHHPEHYEDGISGMSLMDLVEMLVDWKAAGMRHENGGDIIASIEINQGRFGYSDEIKGILINTAHDLGLHNENTIGHAISRKAKVWATK